MGCNGVCFPVLMMNRIMNTRAAALALAAPLLLAAPALADHGKRGQTGATISIQTGNGGIYYHTGNRDYGYRDRGYRDDRYRLNQWGQTRAEERDLRRRAVQACRQAIRREADWLGFRDVDFDDGRQAYQNGRYGFIVTFNEVEFEGRRRDFERPVTCQVRGIDNVKWIEGIPKRGHHNGRRNDRHNSGYRY